MALQYFNQDQILAAARSALRPKLLATMAATVLGAVVLYGLFSIGSATHSFGSIVMHFIGGALALLWILFGLTATAHQIHALLKGEDIPNAKQAACFAWDRAQSILMLPAWGIGLLAGMLIVEMMAIALGKIPGLGLVWLAAISVPLLLLNTVVAVLLLLALFNIAARVAISSDDAGAIRNTLWQLLRNRLPELLLYNLGGALATGLIAVVVLSPLWLGMTVTMDLILFEAPEAALAVQAATGFWGGIAHMVGLVMVGALAAAIASVPGIIITQLTISIHMELDTQDEPAAAGKTASAESKSGDTEQVVKPAPRKRTTRKAASDGTATKRRAPRKRATAETAEAKSEDNTENS